MDKVTTGESRSKEVGNGALETAGEPGWMQGKSQMLDEVNQLVELMTAEKSSFQEKILALESEVDQYHRGTERLKQTLDKKDKNMTRLKFEQQQKSLRSTLHETREELRRVQQEVESVMLSLEQERKSHSEVKSQLSSLHESHTALSNQLSLQTAETKKLKELLNTAQEQNNKCRLQNNTLRSQLENSKRREQKSRDEILALRGRLTRCRKVHEQLQVHCSVLEREVESRVKQASAVQTKKRREETRLAKECRKKDDLLVAYLNEISTCHEEHQTLQKEIGRLKKRISVEEEAKKEVILKLEECVQKNCLLQQQLKSAEENKKQQEEKQYTVLVEKLHTLTSRLESSQREVLQLREEVRSEKERERERIRELMKAKQKEIDTLHARLTIAQRDHQDAMATAERQWSLRLRDTQSDLSRLKEASTRRCVELAKEVWELRSKLEPEQNSYSTAVPCTFSANTK